jgi:small subunit ribosomal protein S17
MSEALIRRTLIGVVLKNAMDKSIVVEVSRRVQHPQFKKFMTLKTRLMAHDPQNTCAVGDRVRIAECRPISRHKRWRLVGVLEKTAAA